MGSQSERGVMADDMEERRRQDLRDLEFYRRRLRPTASDLLRTNELSFKNNKISLQTDKSRERDRDAEGLRAPASLAEIYTDSRYGAERHGGESLQSPPTKAKTEIAWLAVAAGIILGVFGRVVSLDRVVEALVF